MHSPDALSRLQAQVEADFPYWRSRGITISSVGARPDLDYVEIGVTDKAAEAAVRDRYADQPVHVIKRHITPF